MGKFELQFLIKTHYEGIGNVKTKENSNLDIPGMPGVPQKSVMTYFYRHGS